MFKTTTTLKGTKKTNKSLKKVLTIMGTILWFT